jgi:hypothetical protein
MTGISNTSTTPDTLRARLSRQAPSRKALDERLNAAQATAPIPDALTLGPEGRLYLLSWLHANVVCDIPITSEEWRRAWGNAADYQTAVNARRVLAEAVLS